MIRVGIIGLGRSGWELHAAPLQKMDGYQVSAVCDLGAARLAAAAETFQARAYSDPTLLIDDPAVDLVVVATTSNLHAELTIAALRAGKHVVVEKPMALTIGDADAMLAAAANTGRLLTVFHNRHWDRDYQLVKRLVQCGELGELLTLDSRVMTFGPEWSSYGVSDFNPTWRIQAAFGGGFLSDWGPHLIEQCLDLVGILPATVSGHLRSQLWAREVDDYFSLRLSFPSGLLFCIEGSNNARLPLPRWFIVGSEGTLVADGAWGRWTDLRIRRSVAGLVVDLEPMGAGPSSGNRNYDVAEELSAQFYGDLVEAITAGRPPAVTSQRAYEVMLVLDAARRSDATGKPIRL
jgi:scyllo-inositol 2-dehydrogenase (NADP+)